MKQRIRLEVADRGEEVNADADFPGRAALRERILAAHASGDLGLLRSLQAQHRDMRLAYTAPSSTRTVPLTYRMPVLAAVPTVVRAATSATSTLPSDPEREIGGWLVRWGPVPTSNDAGQSIALDVQARDLAAWLAEVDPAAVEVKGDHTVGPIGSFRKFELLADGLWAVAVIERTPAGDIAIASADDGRAAGWSFGADISKCRQTGEVRDGLEVYAGGPVFVVEGSLCPSVADARCVVSLVAGRVPTWRAQAVLAGEQRPVRRQHVRRRRTGWPGKRPSSWRR